MCCKENMIKAIYKRPGKAMVEVEIPNELEWPQGAVEGYIEAVPLRPDMVMIVNEEGLMKMMEYNFWIDLGGMPQMIVGPVLFVGVDGDDFADCPLSRSDLRDFLKSKHEIGGVTGGRELELGRCRPDQAEDPSEEMRGMRREVYSGKRQAEVLSGVPEAVAGGKGKSCEEGI